MRKSIKPSTGALKIAPVTQEDGISCGYCALMAVYNNYRLGDRNLRDS